MDWRWEILGYGVDNDDDERSPVKLPYQVSLVGPSSAAVTLRIWGFVRELRGGHWRATLAGDIGDRTSLR